MRVPYTNPDPNSSFFTTIVSSLRELGSISIVHLIIFVVSLVGVAILSFRFGLKKTRVSRSDDLPKNDLEDEDAQSIPIDLKQRYEKTKKELLLHHSIVNHGTPISLKSTKILEQKLTPNILANDIIPFLQAIAALQSIINEVTNRPHQEVRVPIIIEGSALISFEGITDTFKLVMDVLVPSRNNHIKTMAKLEENEKQAQIEKARVDILSRRRQLTHGKEKEKVEIELARQRAEVEKLELENEKLRFEIDSEKFQMALDILDSINPELSETLKSDFAKRLVKPLNVLVSSDMEPKLLLSSDLEPKGISSSDLERKLLSSNNLTDDEASID